MSKPIKIELTQIKGDGIPVGVPPVAARGPGQRPAAEREEHVEQRPGQQHDVVHVTQRDDDRAAEPHTCSR